MRVHLVNPSTNSFGVSVITPRWLYVIAAATPAEFGDPVIIDEMLDPLDVETIQEGDIVGIGIHTGNALRGYEIGRMVRGRGATVIFGGVHATLYPEEARELGCADAVATGDGDQVWGHALHDLAAGKLQPIYHGGRIDASSFVRARWDLLPEKRYMWATVQTVRGCPKHCSFCSVWRTDGQKPRMRASDPVLEELVELRRRGFRFIVLADDNFYPVSLEDVRLAERQGNAQRVAELKSMRAERFELMERLARLPKDTIFFTQITMEAAEDVEFLKAMRRANIRGALVGVEAVTPEGLKDIYKGFNCSGEELVTRLRKFREHEVHVLGSFIFGLPSDKPTTFDATLDLAQRAGVSFAQFVLLQPLPGTIDFGKWEKSMADDERRYEGVPITRYWLIPPELRPKIYSPHPGMTPDEIRVRTQTVWNRFYSFGRIWERAKIHTKLKEKLAFLMISKLYRQMYANTGIATDSARVQRSVKRARWIGRFCHRLFMGKLMPDLAVPAAAPANLVEFRVPDSVAS